VVSELRALRSSTLKPPLPSPFRFPDPGSSKLQFDSMLKASPDGFRCPKGVELFDGRVFKRDIQTLDDTKLYRSTGWQMVIGEYFSFSKHDKVVFLYQVSTKLPKEHAFKREQCTTWRKALQLPHDWVLTIVYFLDKAKKSRPTVCISRSLGLCVSSFFPLFTCFVASGPGNRVRGCSPAPRRPTKRLEAGSLPRAGITVALRAPDRV
jgi:hypothetical protein